MFSRPRIRVFSALAIDQLFVTPPLTYARASTRSPAAFLLRIPRGLDLASELLAARELRELELGYTPADVGMLHNDLTSPTMSSFFLRSLPYALTVISALGGVAGFYDYGPTGCAIKVVSQYHRDGIKQSGYL